jgi:hypothetical protein
MKDFNLSTVDLLASYNPDFLRVVKTFGFNITDYFHSESSKRGAIDNSAHSIGVGVGVDKAKYRTASLSVRICSVGVGSGIVLPSSAGSPQTIGSSKNALALENGLDPKNPVCADKGEG